MRIKRFLASLLAVALPLCGCALAQDGYDMPYYIGVDLTNQIVTVYNTSDNTIARQMLCSSGMNDSTPVGEFYLEPKGRASERGEWTWLDEYHCWVKFATRIHRGYMFHSLPFARKDEASMIEQSARELGTPTSHGCMRLRVDDARFIAQNCLEGTRVTLYKDPEKQEELRELLLVSSYSSGDGMSYTEFLGYSDDALGRGSGGTEVFDLQHRLIDLGYYDGDANGRYDTSTVAAVKHVQADLGLAQSGVTTAELAELLYSEDAPVSAGQITLREGHSGPVVRRLQSALTRLGLYEGELDSVYDLEVADAVRRFQGACGYKVDGVASPEMQQALYYVLDQLEQTFGADSVPAAEILTEDVPMAALRSSANIIVRSKPTTKSDELGKLCNGDTMLVDGVDGDWAKVSVGSASGYVLKKYLEPYTQQNVILRFTGAGSESYSVGHTMEEYRAGARSLADEFSAYFASGQFAESVAGPVRYATVDTGSDDTRLNLRAAPDPDAEVLAEVPNGTNLRALGEDGDWTQVGYDERIGYLRNDYLRFWEGDADEAELAGDTQDAGDAAGDGEGEARGSVKAVVICGGAKSAPVYDAGSEDAQKLGSLTEGTQLDVVSMGEGDAWVRIRYQGHEGYMLDSNLQFQLM